MKVIAAEARLRRVSGPHSRKPRAKPTARLAAAHLAVPRPEDRHPSERHRKGRENRVVKSLAQTARETVIARMKPEPKATPQEVLAGLVERVTFHNEENGFCVLRTKARGHRDLVTVVGQAASISAGEWITASGEWINDRTHGQQFRARFLRTSAPTSIEGIEKYLGSGMIRGIGPVYARKLVRAFGEQVFDTIETEPGRLQEVEGIGPVRAKSHYRRLGRAEGRPRDHDVSAFERRRNGPRRADLQDLRLGRRAGDDGEPLSPDPRRPRHRLQDGRRDRDEARRREDRDDPSPGRRLVRPRRGDGRGALRAADQGADTARREPARGPGGPDRHRPRSRAFRRRRGRRQGRRDRLRVSRRPLSRRADHRRAADQNRGRQASLAVDRCAEGRRRGSRSAAASRSPTASATRSGWR